MSPGVLTNLVKLTRKPLHWSLFWIILQPSNWQLYQNRDYGTDAFLWILRKIVGTPFLWNTSGLRFQDCQNYLCFLRNVCQKYYLLFLKSESFYGSASPYRSILSIKTINGGKNKKMESWVTFCNLLPKFILYGKWLF